MFVPFPAAKFLIDPDSSSETAAVNAKNFFFTTAAGRVPFRSQALWTLSVARKWSLQNARSR